MGIQIGSNDLGPCPFCENRKYQANRPLAYDQKSLAGFNVEGLDGLHAGVDRLYKRGLLVGNSVRQFDHSVTDDPIHHANILGKASAARFKTSSGAHLLVYRALSKNLMAAVITLTAGDVMKHHHPVADPEVLDIFSCGHDLTGSLMAKNPRGGVRTGGDLLEIRPTDATGMNAYQNLTALNRRNRNGFQAHILLSVINGSSHQFRNDRVTDAGLCLCRCLHQPSIFSRPCPYLLKVVLFSMTCGI